MPWQCLLLLQAVIVQEHQELENPPEQQPSDDDVEFIALHVRTVTKFSTAVYSNSPAAPCLHLTSVCILKEGRVAISLYTLM